MSNPFPSSQTTPAAFANALGELDDLDSEFALTPTSYSLEPAHSSIPVSRTPAPPLPSSPLFTTSSTVAVMHDDIKRVPSPDPTTTRGEKTSRPQPPTISCDQTTRQPSPTTALAPGMTQHDHTRPLNYTANIPSWPQTTIQSPSIPPPTNIILFVIVIIFVLHCLLDHWSRFLSHFRSPSLAGPPSRPGLRESAHAYWKNHSSWSALFRNSPEVGFEQ